MAWFKVDDHFWGHPKRLACTLTEIGLWVTAGSWSAQQLTDGHIPRHVLRTFGARPRDASGLVSAGLWLEVGEGWQFHDWHLFQPSREAVEASRKEAADRKKQWRDKKQAERAGQSDVSRGGHSDVPPVSHWDIGVRHSDVPAVSHPPSVPSVSQTCPTYPDPTRPDPDPIRSSLREELQDQGQTLSFKLVEQPPRESPFDEWWDAYPIKKAKKTARAAYARARRTTHADVLLAAAARYRDDPTRDPSYTLLPTTWLNQGRWEDEGPARPQSNVRPMTTRVAEGDAILREAFDRGRAQRPELGA